MSAAGKLLAKLRDTGVSARADGDRLILAGATGRLTADELDVLRTHKPELLDVLRGDACRHCGDRLGWPRIGAGLTYADGTSECMACADREVGRLLAAGSRAAESPDALADPAEVMLRGEFE